MSDVGSAWCVREKGIRGGGGGRIGPMAGKSDPGNWDKMVQRGGLKFINGLRLHPIDTINVQKALTLSAHSGGFTDLRITEQPVFQNQVNLKLVGYINCQLKMIISTKLPNGFFGGLLTHTMRTG